MITGGFASNSAVLDGVEYAAAGYTASGAPYYRDSSSSVYIYWDPDCNGAGEPARWIVHALAPSTSATSDLDGHGACDYAARIYSEDSSSPPLGTETWKVGCDGSFTDNTHAGSALAVTSAVTARTAVAAAGNRAPVRDHGGLRRPTGRPRRRGVHCSRLHRLGGAVLPPLPRGAVLPPLLVHLLGPRLQRWRRACCLDRGQGQAEHLCLQRPRRRRAVFLQCLHRL